MISASNYVDVYAARQLRNIFLIKDKLCEKKNRSCICEKEEMVGPSRLMYLVKQPRLPPLLAAQKESMPRWLLELQACRA